MRCPKCGSSRTFPTPETAYEHFCGVCHHVWDLTPCTWHGLENCTSPECIGVLRSEVQQAELWGGTE